MKECKIGIAVTVRAEFSIIDQFIRYYLTRGYDEIYLFLDDPDFNKYENIIQHYNGVKFIICDDNYWSSINNFRFDSTNKFEKPNGIEQRQYCNYTFARKNCSCDWMALIDIDELIYSQYNLKTLLSLLPLNIFSIRMLSKEAVYSHNIAEDDIFNTLLFKQNVRANVKNSQKYYDEKLYSKGGFWGHTLGKIFARTNENVKIFNNHFLKPINDELIVDIEFDFLCLLHFEGMSQKYFIEKQMRRFNNEVIVKCLASYEYKRLNFFKEEYIKFGLNALKNMYEHMHIFTGDRLENALKDNFLSEINFNELAKDFDIGVQNFHFNNLYYSNENDCVFSSKNHEKNMVNFLKFKVNGLLYGFFFFKDNENEYYSLVSDDVYLRKNTSPIFSIFEVEQYDEFIAFKNKNNYLISFKTGTVKFNSNNLGDWELYNEIS